MDAKKDYQEIAKQGSAFSQAAPDVMKAFGGLHAAAIKDEALSVKTKELIALAISVTVKCQPCIHAHVRGCIKAGVTREELADAMGVVVLMGGGPGSAYSAQALSIYDQLTES